MVVKRFRIPALGYQLVLFDRVGGVGYVKHRQLDIVGNTVLFKQVLEYEFGRGALTGGKQRATGKIRHRVYLIAALEHIEHAERGYAEHHNVALELVVERGGEVHGYGGNVEFARDERGGDSRGIRIDLDIVLRIGFLIHEGSRAHAGGALQSRDADDGIVLGLPAGNERRARCDHQHGKQYGN